MIVKWTAGEDIKQYARLTTNERGEAIRLRRAYGNKQRGIYMGTALYDCSKGEVLTAYLLDPRISTEEDICPRTKEILILKPYKIVLKKIQIRLTTLKQGFWKICKTCYYKVMNLKVTKSQS